MACSWCAGYPGRPADDAQKEPEATEALLAVLEVARNIRHLKVGLLPAASGDVFYAALSQLTQLKFLIIQSGVCVH